MLKLWRNYAAFIPLKSNNRPAFNHTVLSAWTKDKKKQDGNGSSLMYFNGSGENTVVQQRL